MSGLKNAESGSVDADGIRFELLLRWFVTFGARPPIAGIWTTLLGQRATKAEPVEASIESACQPVLYGGRLAVA
jgi:hypothetical protein